MNYRIFQGRDTDQLDASGSVSAKAVPDACQGESAEYKKLVADACDGEDGPDTYEWGVGIPP